MDNYQMDNNQNNQNEAAVLARRRALAAALKNGQDVVVAPSGEVEFKQKAQTEGQTAIQVPSGKLA